MFLLPKSHVEVIIPRTSEHEFVWCAVAADLIVKDRYIRVRPREDTDTQRECHMKTRQGDAAAHQGTLTMGSLHQKLEKGKEEFPVGFRGITALQAP